MKKSKRLFLLDAYALIYRAYFAFIKNPRVNSKGINTSAVFGFANSLIEIINKEEPTHLAVIFDTQKPTGRHIEYPEYKAQREEMPEDLRSSLPYIDRLLEVFSIPKLFKDGFEADDLIGTLAKKAEKEGFQVFMMTPDKDFAQLVSNNIFMYRPATKWQPTTILGVKEVLEKFQIQEINQVIDFLGMMGDAADNIPGIPGVGEKTAQKFIKEYGSIEGLFENTHKLKGKLKEKVEGSKEIGKLSKKLVTIITDAPIRFDPESMRLNIHQQKEIKVLFEELEFRNLFKRLFPNKSITEKDHQTQAVKQEQNNQQNIQIDLFKLPNKKIKNRANYTLINSEKKLLEFTQKINHKKKIAFQIITTNNDSLENNNIIGVSISTENNQAYYIHNKLVKHQLLKNVFTNHKIKKVGFDIKFMMKVLKRNNIEITGELFDVEIAHYLLQPDMRHTLDLLSEVYLGIELIQKESIIGRGKTKVSISSLPEEAILDYAAQRADIIFQLEAPLNKEMKEAEVQNLFYEIEMPLSIVLAEMELEGILLDTNMLKDYNITLSNELSKLILKIQELANNHQFNIASPKQLGEVLFNKLQLSKKPKKTKSGQFSTSEETLIKLKGSHPIIEEILKFREIKKLLSTYVQALPELMNPITLKVHTTFNQSVAATGRLSSTNPNLQNIPIRTRRGMKIREAFIPRSEEYTLLAADYSQIELRIMASLSKDKSMLKAFNEGIDIHTATAAKVYSVHESKVNRTMRANAKSVNFGIIYGISPFGLAQNINVSRKEAKEIIDEYFEQFPKVKDYMEKAINQARESEYVQTLMGRRRYLYDINSKNAVVRSVAERNAINAPIQGSAADIIKKAMIQIHKQMKIRLMKSKMLLQVHDELVFDMHNSEKEELRVLVKQEMEKAVKLQVPLVVDLGEGANWLVAH